MKSTALAKRNAPPILQNLPNNFKGYFKIKRRGQDEVPLEAQVYGLVYRIAALGSGRTLWGNRTGDKEIDIKKAKKIESGSYFANTLPLSLIGELDYKQFDIFRGSYPYSWYEMWDTNLNALSLQRASEEETLNYLQNKINGLKQKVDLAKQNPESVSDRLNVYVQGLGIKFSDNPEERRKELKLMACIEARKQFRLQEIHDSLASAQSLDERLKSKEMHYIPQTDVYAIMEVGEPDCFVSAPIAIYDISDKRLGESKIASFVKGLYPKLFGENKKSASYVAYAVPKECLDMVEEVVTVKSGPPRKEKLKPLLNIIDV